MKSWPDIGALAHDLRQGTTDARARKVFERSKVWGEGWGTHVPFLARHLATSEGPVLELGSGHFSTPLMLEVCRGMNRPLVTVETDPEWAQKHLDLGHEHLTITRDYCEILTQGWATRTYWGLVFLDTRPDDGRLALLKAVAALPKVYKIVMHDTCNPYFQGVDAFLDTFPVREDYTHMTSVTSCVRRTQGQPVDTDTREG